jgi:hypothetical protein
MELLSDENKKLKDIIRKSDKRIKYLEERIKKIINGLDINYCFLCDNICEYDEERCEYNMFCESFICISCVNKCKNDKFDRFICKYDKCNKWCCLGCTNNNFLQECIECKNLYCYDHYDYDETKKENKWICDKCYKKSQISFEYEYL